MSTLPLPPDSQSRRPDLHSTNRLTCETFHPLGFLWACSHAVRKSEAVQRVELVFFHFNILLGVNVKRKLNTVKKKIFLKIFLK